MITVEEVDSRHGIIRLVNPDTLQIVEFQAIHYKKILRRKGLKPFNTKEVREKIKKMVKGH